MSRINPPSSFPEASQSTGCCVHCGRSQKQNEEFTKYGLCEKCNQVLRRKVLASLDVIKKISESPNATPQQIEQALTLIAQLEENREQYPFFKSGTEEYRVQLTKKKALLVGIPEESPPVHRAARKAVWFWTAVLLILAVWIPALYWMTAEPWQPRVSEYTPVSRRAYVRGGEPCVGYQVVIPQRANLSNLISYAQEVCAMNDGYSLHTLWFYRSPEETSGPYTVAMAEQDFDRTLSVYQNGALVASVPDRPSSRGKVVGSVLLVLWFLLVIRFCTAKAQKQKARGQSRQIRP